MDLNRAQQLRLMSGVHNCAHEHVTIYRFYPPRSVCQDCGARVEPVWVAVEEPDEESMSLIKFSQSFCPDWEDDEV